MNRIALCFVSLLGACALDDDETIVESIEQGVSSTALSNHHCASGTCTYNLGATATSTCVLAGVSGELAHSGANATIKENGANWELMLSSGIGAKALCVSTTTNRVQVTKRPIGFFSPTLSIHGSAAQRCFLSGLHMFSSAPFSTDETWLGLEHSFSSWDGTSTHELEWAHTNSDVEVSITCIDVVGDNGVWAWAGSNVDVTGNLALNPRTGGVACALTGVGGLFDDPYQGVNIGYDSATRYWNWSLDSQTGATARCFR